MKRPVVAVVATVVLVTAWFVATLLSESRPLLGLDLQGGTSVVLFPVEGSNTEGLDVAAEIISDRVDGLGVVEPDVSRQGDTIVVDLPGAEDPEEAAAVIGQTAQLRFRPVIGFVCPFDPAAPSESVDDVIGGRLSDVCPTGSDPAAEPGFGSGVPTSTREDDIEAAVVVLPGPSDDDTADAALRYVLGPSALSGESVTGADNQFIQGQWIVEIDFEDNTFVESIAIPFEGQQVAIVLDATVVSAPVINPGIDSSTVVIEGTFSQGESQDLALVLRYGSLPVQFDETEQTSRTISPTLGSDQLRAGIIAGIVGLVLVTAYMLAYYRLLGLVVVAGLALTGMIFFSLVSWLSGAVGLTLTLAGVTGLIVSVGVTVDSYIVYFERLKDEVRGGRSIRTSADVGFRKSFRTIVAADLVSLFGAVILYSLAAGSVRGFAFFLGISTIIDLVLSYFFMYPLVVLVTRNGALVRLPGVGIAVSLDVAGATR